MKCIFLSLATNLAVMRVLSFTPRLLGIDRDLTPGSLPPSRRAFGITDMPAWLALFASHPPIEAGIAALRDADAVVMAR